MKARGMTTILCLASPVLLCVVADPARKVKADFIFGTPANLGAAVNSPVLEGSPDISADGLTLFYDTSGDIWVSTRASLSEPWGEPVNLGTPVNSTASDWGPNISSDGLTLYFAATNRSGGFGAADLWVATRQTISGPWGHPVNLGPTVNSAYTDGHPSVTRDELELYFSGTHDGTARPGGFGGSDIWLTTRTTKDDAWGAPVNLGPTVNGPSFDGEPDISPDGLTLFFASDRQGGSGSFDIWMTMRASRSDPWTQPLNLGPGVNSSSVEPTPAISEDGSCLYFMSNRPGGFGDFDMWHVPILPLVDFISNGFVDIADLVVLIEHWGGDEPSVDIGPMPWGDGVVDAADLEVLMRHWGQEAYDPTLIAYWRLDEAEGRVAADSAGTSDGTLIGNLLWQPDSGKVGGALQLDGVDDCVTTGFVRDPSEGPFSVFAWIKGGMPGQVIVSQMKGAHWLMAGGSDGELATELKGSGRLGKPLTSPATITDGTWHRVGLVWDGSDRVLYVDGSEVARDTQASLVGTYLGLYIGAGKGQEPGTFWSGLIDDVRIYSRAVRP